MGLFGKKHETLSDAVLAGDIHAAREMLQKGADPNKFDPGDTAGPIHYAVNHGPEMVQLLIDHGADVNVSARGRTPLANAEGRGLMDVAAVLRKAGAQVRGSEDDLDLDPRIRVQLEPQIGLLVVMARINFPTAPPESIADKAEAKLNLQFPLQMTSQQQQAMRKDIRTLIIRKCKGQ